MPNAIIIAWQVAEKPNRQQAEFSYAEKIISIFINDLVRKFRLFNNDKFTLRITGLETFVNKNDLRISYLFHCLNDNGITIFFTDSKERIEYLDITCINETRDETYNYNYQIQSLPSIFELSSKTNIPTVGLIVMKIVAQTILKQKSLYKAIVLDLDDTLWLGTLAEVGIEKIKDNLKSEYGTPFIAFMNFIKILAIESGIYIAICSRNDSKMVISSIEGLDESIFPLKNQIDCLVANYNDKSENLKEIAHQLSILPQSMIFIDDNQIIRDDVVEKMPEVFVPQWDNHSDLVVQLIAGCFFEKNELSVNSQERRRQFKIIQTERTKNRLPELLIKAFIDENNREAKALYAKTNQFKLSQLNANFEEGTTSLYFELYRKNGETLGICSAITFLERNSEKDVLVYNWAVSCRYFEIGLEEFVLHYLLNKWAGKSIYLAIQYNNMNQKAKEWINKYHGNVFIDNSDSFPDDSYHRYYIDNTFSTRETLRSNTNLILM